MTNEVKKRLLEVINACDAVAEFVAGKNFAAYEGDRLLRSAVERQFEIIGEALNKSAGADGSLTAKFSEIHRIIGLRNRLIHGYDNVDDEIPLGRRAEQTGTVEVASGGRFTRSRRERC